MIFQAKEIHIMQKVSEKTVEIKGKKGFHESMKWLLFTSQFFALFPLNGVLRSDYKDMRFSWCSFRTFYSLVISCVSTVEAFGFVHYSMRTHRFGNYDLNDVVYYARGTLTCLAFLMLAKNWPMLMKEFERMERRMVSYPPSKYLHTKLRIITIAIFFAAGVEHLTAQTMNFLKSSKCEKTLNDTLHHYFAGISYHKLFLFVPYSLILGIIFQFMNFITVFGWTFIDVFIIHASTNFSEKIVQLKKHICSTIEKQVSSPTTWMALRENYTHLYHLFVNFNKKMNNITLVSFASNIYFLLTQVYFCLKSDSSQLGVLNQIYFVFTITLLISRTALVCFYGASIEEESYNLLNTLVSTPSNLYNEELERFIVEVDSSPMILSGRKYFYITRTLILKIAGSIVTYELVMIQFSDRMVLANGDKSC